jgi:hypothetical protein
MCCPALLEGLRNTTKISVTISGVQVEIRRGYLQKTKQKIIA